MSSIYLMTAITRRDSIRDFYKLYQEYGLDIIYLILGRGTATESMADLFGLKNNENAIGLALVTEDTWRSIKKDFYYKLRLDTPGSGIVILSPISSIGGEGQFAYLLSGQKYERGEESVLKNTDRELLVAICNQGYNDLVMDAARSAGAKGGTVIHAIGTGVKKAEEFLGVSLATEKDVILIIVNQDQKRPVMEAVMKNAGIDTKAKSVVISLPVTDSAGLHTLDDLLKASEPKAEEAPQSGTHS